MTRAHARAQLYHRLRRIFDEHERAVAMAVVASDLTDSDAATVLRLAFCQYSADCGFPDAAARVLADAQKAEQGNGSRRRAHRLSNALQPPKRGA
jgi:hypothetical protein